MFIGEGYYSEEELTRFGFRRLGKNVKIKRSVTISHTENLAIENNVRIDDFVVIICSGEPCELGSFVHIASHCVFLGRSGFAMADFAGLSPQVTIVTLSDDYSGGKLTNPTVARRMTGGDQGRVTLGRHVIIGAGSVIFPAVTIGEGSSIGALSLVNSSLDEWGVYAGIPARRLKDRKKDLLTLEKALLAGDVS